MNIFDNETKRETCVRCLNQRIDLTYRFILWCCKPYKHLVPVIWTDEKKVVQGQVKKGAKRMWTIISRNKHKVYEWKAFEMFVWTVELALRALCAVRLCNALRKCQKIVAMRGNSLNIFWSCRGSKHNMFAPTSKLQKGNRNVSELCLFGFASNLLCFVFICYELCVEYRGIHSFQSLLPIGCQLYECASHLFDANGITTNWGGFKMFVVVRSAMTDRRYETRINSQMLNNSIALWTRVL